MMIAAPELPSPSEWGWKKKVEGGWEISWTTLPEATLALYAVAARRAAGDAASARRLLCNALLSVSVVDCTLTEK